MFLALKHYIKLYFKSVGYLWRSSKRIVFALYLIIPFQALLPATSLFITTKIVNNVSSLTMMQLTFLLIIWGLTFLLGHLFTPLVTLLQGRLTDRLTYKLNTDLMKKSSSLQTIDYFEDADFYNDIELLSSEASWRPVNLIVFGTSIASQFLTFISMVLIFWDFHWLIALLMLLALIPQALMNYKIQQQAFEVLVSNSEESRQLDYFSGTLLSAEAIKEVRLYNLYGLFLHRYTETFNQIFHKTQSVRWKKFLVSLLFLLLTTSVSVGSFFYIVLEAQSNLQQVGGIMLFSTSITYALTSLSRFVEETSLLYDTLLYMEKFFAFITVESEQNNGELDFKFDEKISFKNITFTYKNAHMPTLKNISFSVKKGERIAIVGENGAGKSTLVKLICQFYPLSQGDIMIDNISLNNFNKKGYRRNLTAIFQDFSKFNLTLKENIALSQFDKIDDIEKMNIALSKSGLELGKYLSYEDILGKKFSDGKELSGGQWQKVALARAFFSDAPILILDEPTAAIDARAEFELFNRFLELTQGKTVFYVTHRLASVKQADKVLVLKDGEVVAFDTHSHLIKTNDYYREFYTMQSSLYHEI